MNVLYNNPSLEGNYSLKYSEGKKVYICVKYSRVEVVLCSRKNCVYIIFLLI
jgi:hypothetical protein